jgi:hypothetical protein
VVQQVASPLMRSATCSIFPFRITGIMFFTCIAIQVVADISAELATKMPSTLTDADAAAITFQVARHAKSRYEFVLRTLFGTIMCKKQTDLLFDRSA